jgi:molybdenum cofactor biosynthesis protein B
MSIEACVITVSDTRDVSDDVGGALVAELLEGAGHVVVARTIVRDEREAIAGALDEAIGRGVPLVISTGGTGIAPRDVTYEAIAPRLEKVLDGFGEAFRRLSWEEVGPRAILSRAVAGTIGRTLVVVLPGSPKAVRLAMESVLLPVVGHAVQLLRK